MKNEQPAASSRLYSPRATLCAIGLKLRSMKLFDTIADHVKIKQKAIKHTPVEKLTDAFIAILAGAHGLAEINTRVRSDAALQRAFGRSSCAEQSVVQETLDACTVENVRQMKHAFKALMRAHSRAYRHPYQAGLQLLDVDMTGLPCGHRAEKASKGYFANKPGRHGRQMARVVATHYEEVVLDWVGPGNVQLNKVLRPLVEETEWMLDLDAGKRARTVLRIDAGGGSINDVNWLLSRGSGTGRRASRFCSRRCRLARCSTCSARSRSCSPTRRRSRSLMLTCTTSEAGPSRSRLKKISRASD
jgi:hypothetical protein